MHAFYILTNVADLKPENIVFKDPGKEAFQTESVKLIDFGVGMSSSAPS